MSLPIAVEIRADLPKIRQTLLNLLGNATKFTAKGRITLSVRRIKPRISSTGVNSAARQLDGADSILDQGHGHRHDA